MRYLKTYRLFESNQSSLSQEQIEWLDKCTEGTWGINPQNGLVDVRGNFDCSNQDLSDFKGVRFGRIDGDFDCRTNYISSLEGSPRFVEGGFNCNNNDITSLAGSPQSVYHFSCQNNKLTILEGAPQEVRGGFFCSDNQLTSLEGAPDHVVEFYCEMNKLTSLIGGPRRVIGTFLCGENLITSLEGAPQKIGSGFFCKDNPVSSDTLHMILDHMQKEDVDYTVALSVLREKIPLDDWNMIQKPDGFDFDAIKNVDDFGVI